MNNKKSEHDLHIELKLKLSPTIKEFIATTAKLGKIGIRIGRILIPLLMTASIAIKHLPPNISTPSSLPRAILEKTQ